MVIEEFAVPSVGPHDVLVRVKACGVCRTDLQIADGLMSSLVDPFPRVLGHEVAGVVEQVGPEVAQLSPGDRVAVYFIVSCGRCQYCLSGDEEVCLSLFSPRIQIFGFTLDGGYAQFVNVPADCVLPLPPELDFVSAAPLICGGLTSYGGLKNADLRPGQRVAVLGIGGLGHLAIPIARSMGAEVIAITSTDSKVETARQLGAHHVVDGGRDVGKRLREIGGADVVLSTTIDPEAIGQVMAGLAPKGTLVLTGLTTDPLPVVPFMQVFRQQRIIGSYAGSRSDLRELFQLAVQNDIRPITEVYQLEEANEVHERLRANQVRFRAVLTPG